MSKADAFKMIHSALSAPPEKIHQSLEEAARSVQSELGNTHPIWIDGKPASNRSAFEDRSPIDRDVLIGRFQKSRREDARLGGEVGRTDFFPSGYGESTRRI